MIKQIVFLSHQFMDKPIVKKVGDFLSTSGIETILDEWTFRKGKSLAGEIEAGIKKANSFVLFWSVNASSSPYVQFEDEVSLLRRIKDDSYTTQIVRLDDTPLPKRHEFILYHDWRRGKPGSKLFQEHLVELKRSILGLPAKEAPPIQSALEASPNQNYKNSRLLISVNKAARMLRNRNTAIRKQGLDVLIQLGARNILLEAMGHERREVRETAAEGAATLKIPEALPILVAGLHNTSKRNPDPLIRGAGEYIQVYGTYAVEVVLEGIPSSMNSAYYYRWVNLLVGIVDERTIVSVLKKYMQEEVSRYRYEWLLEVAFKSGVRLRKEDVIPCIDRYVVGIDKRTLSLPRCLCVAEWISNSRYSNSKWASQLVEHWLVKCFIGECYSSSGSYKDEEALAKTALKMGTSTPDKLSSLAEKVSNKSLKKILLDLTRQ